MKSTQVTNTDIKTFTDKAAAYKKLIDEDIAAYSKQVQVNTLQNYGKNARLEMDAYLSLLSRGGKRIRGALVMLGYEMSGGTDSAMILQAARAMEMLHAYILIIDDIQDRSIVRRGGKSVHVALAEYHRQHHLTGNADHFGVAIALNAALSGAHAAQMILSNLSAEDSLKIAVLRIINSTMLITAHGQTSDIMNEVVASVTNEDIERVLEWKTAHYTFLNPLHVGMVLAGAGRQATKGITEYAMRAGKAFQITDDILGTFGSEFESGKSPMDDIKEGKRTVLTQFSLENSKNGDKNFLIQMLGNEHLKQAEFERCKDILVDSGAVEFARKTANEHVKVALTSLENEAHIWTPEGVSFLRGLAQYLLLRQS